MDKKNKKVKLNDLSERLNSSIVKRYLEHLGWDLKDENQVQVNYSIGYDQNTSETIDYVLSSNLEIYGPEIIIEIQDCEDEDINPNATANIRKYFDLIDATYAVVTNGIIWQWYQADPNSKKKRLYEKPFLVIDVKNPRTEDQDWLRRINPKEIRNKGKTQHLSKQLSFKKYVKEWFDRNLEKPSDAFTAFLLTDIYPYERTYDETKFEEKRKIIQEAFVESFSETS